MKIKIGKIEIGGGALLLLSAAYFFDSSNLLPLVIAAAAAHELGHYLVLRILGRHPGAITLGFTGVSMTVDRPQSYGQEILTALGGPAASAVLTLLSSAIARFFGTAGAYAFAGVNLVFCAFNILPVFPLDGGRAIYAAVSFFFGPRAAERAIYLSSCVLIFAAAVAGTLLLIVTKHNFTLLAAAIWLLVCYCKCDGNSIKSGL